MFVQCSTIRANVPGVETHLESVIVRQVALENGDVSAPRKLLSHLLYSASLAPDDADDGVILVF